MELVDAGEVTSPVSPHFTSPRLGSSPRRRCVTHSGKDRGSEAARERAGWWTRRGLKVDAVKRWEKGSFFAPWKGMGTGGDAESRYIGKGAEVRAKNKSDYLLPSVHE